MPRYSEPDLARLLNSNPDLIVPPEVRKRPKELPSTLLQMAWDESQKRDAATPHSGVNDYPEPRRTEHDLQVAVIDACNLRAQLDARWGMIFAIPNGGQRSKAAAGKLKAEGVRSGVPDLCVPVARHGYHGAFIELKVGRNKPTENQSLWMSLLKDQGYKVAVFWDDPVEVIEWIKWYLAG